MIFQGMMTAQRKAGRVNEGDAVRDRLRSGRRLAVRKEAPALVLKASLGLKNSEKASIDHAASEPLPQTRWALCGDISLKRQAFNDSGRDIVNRRMQLRSPHVDFHG
ncbi:MAG: hypothetical protein P4L76_09770 [Beijerinckiaceae bacterium]|nr:hypothetical protein [Beijerinckiaceae bacterium]